MSVHRKKVYPAQNIQKQIRAAPNLETLETLRRVVVGGIKSGAISGDTARKLERTGAARYRELQESLIVTPGGPRSKGGRIILP